MHPERSRVFTNLSIVYAVWGSMYLAIGLVVREAPPILAMGIRYGLAGCALLLIIAARSGRQRIAFTGRQLAVSAGLGVFMLALSNGLISLSQFVGMASGLVALFVALVPLWIVVLNAFAGRRPGPMGALGIALGLIGMAVLVVGGRSDGGNETTWLGAGMVLCSGFVWAVGSWVQPRLPRPPDILAGASVQMIFAGLSMSTLGLLIGERMPTSMSWVTWGALAYLILIGSMVGFSAFVWLISHGYVTQASTQAYVSPVVAVFLGWLVVGETVSVWVIVGGGIVLFSVGAVLRDEARSRRHREIGDSAGEATSVVGELPD